MPGVLMELEMRSVEPGDMKSVIVDEMSIRWSAIRSSVECGGGVATTKTKQFLRKNQTERESTAKRELYFFLFLRLDGRVNESWDSLYYFFFCLLEMLQPSKTKPKNIRRIINRAMTTQRCVFIAERP